MTSVMARQARTVAGAFAANASTRAGAPGGVRIWWAFPPFAAFLVAVPVSFGRVFAPEHMTFYWGVGLGVAFGVVVALADSPPHHIERWRKGAEGEKRPRRRCGRLSARAGPSSTTSIPGGGTLTTFSWDRRASSFSRARTSAVPFRWLPASCR